MFSPEIKALVEEATLFTSTFLVPIMESVPHIYLSCLPFIPASTQILKNHLDYQGLAKVNSGQKSNWMNHVLIFEGHTEPVTCVAYAPEGQIIASGSRDNTIRIWNHRTRDSVVLSKHTNYVRCIAFSPDARRLVSGSDDRSLIVWDLETSLPIWEPLLGHREGVRSVEFSPSGDFLASGGAKDAIIRLWDIALGEQIGILGDPSEGNDSSVHSISFSSDGQQLVSAGYSNKSVRVWDVGSRSLLRNISTGSQRSAVALFSPDMTHIVISTREGRLFRLSATGDPANGEVKESFGRHDTTINCIAFSPSGPSGSAELVSCSRDRSIRFWDTNSGVRSGPCLYGHTAAVSSVMFSPDGKHLLSGSTDHTVRLWIRQIAEQSAERLQQHARDVKSIKYSPDGLHIATGSGDRTVLIWRAENRELVGKLEGVHAKGIRCIAWSSDSRQLATSSLDRTIQLWDVRKLKPLGSPLQQGDTGATLPIVLSPDGKILISGSNNSRLGLWDLTGNPPHIRLLKGHIREVTSVAFSPRGTTFASASLDTTIIIWDAESATPVGEPIQVDDNESFFSVAYSPDGNKLAGGSAHQITVWDVDSRTMIGIPLIGHTDRVWSIAFSPCGRHLVSGSDDNTVCVWDLERSVMLGKPLQGHHDWVRSVAFSPNGMQVASASDDRTVRVWDVLIDPDSDTPPEEVVLYNMRQYPPSLFSAHKFNMTDDGWIVNDNGDLLLWVPHENRLGLRGPGVRELNNLPITELDFEHFKCGTEWAQCYPGS